MRQFFIVTGVLEVVTGLAFIVVPSQIATLLLGAPITAPPASVMARLFGVALLALGLACFLLAGNAQGRAARRLAAGAVFYDIAALVGLVYAGLGLGMSGVLIWPGALLHLALAIWGVMLLRKAAQRVEYVM